jgi:hypothetical protein
MLMSNLDRNTYAPSYGAGVAQAGTQVYDQGLRSYMIGIYNHMTLALAISGLVAIAVFWLSTTTDAAQAMQGARLKSGLFLTPIGYALFVSPLKWAVMLAPLAFILVLSWRFDRMSYTTLLGTFWAYAAVMGLSLATILLVFTGASIAKVFFITAASFAALSLWGYTTKKDLSGMGSFLVMGLFGLIIAGLVNIFLKSPALQFAISAIGVLVFAGLTAWDTQRMKEDYDYVSQDGELMQKSSVMGALSLYLNFINLFQFLMSLFGDRE